MMTNKICPVMTIGLAARKQGLIAGCRDNCAWYNSGTDMCAVYGIYDELVGIEGQLSLISDSIDRLRDIQEGEE